MSAWFAIGAAVLALLAWTYADLTSGRVSLVARSATLGLLLVAIVALVYGSLVAALVPR